MALACAVSPFSNVLKTHPRQDRLQHWAKGPVEVAVPSDLSWGMSHNSFNTARNCCFTYCSKVHFSGDRVPLWHTLLQRHTAPRDSLLHLPKHSSEQIILFSINDVKVQSESRMWDNEWGHGLLGWIAEELEPRGLFMLATKWGCDHSIVKIKWHWLWAKNHPSPTQPYWYKMVGWAGLRFLNIPSLFPRKPLGRNVLALLWSKKSHCKLLTAPFGEGFMPAIKKQAGTHKGDLEEHVTSWSLIFQFQVLIGIWVFPLAQWNAATDAASTA